MKLVHKTFLTTSVAVPADGRMDVGRSAMPGNERDSTGVPDSHRRPHPTIRWPA